MSHIKVSVVIVNYNTCALTKACIDSVWEQTKDLACEVILVDNASTDGSRDAFTNREDIHYIFSEENLGFGRANNLGYTAAGGEHIFLLNSDTLLRNNAIKLLSDFLDNAPADVGCVGCVLQNADGLPIHSFGDFPTPHSCWQKTKEAYGLCRRQPHNEPLPTDTYPKEVDYITGAALMIRRSVIEQYGFFDPDFFMYWEETELQRRYARHGIRRLVINTPAIVHLVGASVQKGTCSARGLLMLTESYYIYLLKAEPRDIRTKLALLNLFVLPKIVFGSTPWLYKRRISSVVLRKTLVVLRAKN